MRTRLLIDILDILFENTYFSIANAVISSTLDDITATNHSATMDAGKVNSTFTFSVRPSEPAACFDSVPIAVDYILNGGNNYNYPIRATAQMQYILIDEYGTPYYVSTNSVTLSDTVPYVYD